MDGGKDTRSIRSDVESKRILERVSREAGSDLLSTAKRTIGRVGDHIAAEDADRDDWIEVMGTRIGRMIATVFTVALFVGLVIFLVRGG